MRKIITLSVALLMFFVGFGQKKTPVITQKDGTTIQKYYHKNGTVSTLETWDNNHRFGEVKGFNRNGAQIFMYHLRAIGGHASAYITYYADGQVQKVEYSDAPDAGIQHYQSWTTFNENGEQTGFSESKYPDDTLVTFRRTQQEQPVVQRPQETIVCAVPYCSVVKVVNLTRRKIPVFFKALKNNELNRLDKNIIVPKKGTVVADSIMMAERYIDASKVYAVSIAEGKKYEGYKLLLTEPTTSGSTKTYTWYIVREE
ncbi:hypothetical protein ACLI08_07030 [Flavobacterium sp. RNTU_13]|uniref:hypothetical protein n=1 Tax=Flavobacterium sp. RNTU_13 TaxID=3375145 RepID=UPI003985F27C